MAVWFATCTDRVSAQPSLSIHPRSTIELDTIGPKIINPMIVLSNDGTEPLIVREIHTSCGCTTAELTNDTLPPHSMDTLRIRIDLHNQEGLQAKEIYLLTNDPKDTLKKVLFKVFVARDLQCFPLMFPFGRRATATTDAKRR